MERIAKVIARAGICSRREAEKLIEQGKVKVNNKKIDSPALNVSEKDKIEVDGKLISKEETRIWIFHKPKGCLTTTKDPQGRQTIFDILPKNLPRVITIGRLDYNTEGLLLLTNDGEFARSYELPSADMPRTYKCRVHGKFNDSIADKISKGLTIDGLKYKSASVELISSQGDNFWIYITITEGKNREVRNIFEYFDLKVNRLIRVSFGPYILGDLPKEKVVEVEPKRVFSKKMQKK